MAKPHLMADYRRKHRPAVSAALKARAEALRCPKCKRGAAMQKVEIDPFLPLILVCRYADCGHESN
jgi:hypothetical protein